MKSNRIPPWIQIRPSRIPGAGLGAFSRQLLPAGRELGEYRGRRITREQFHRQESNPYVWEVRGENDEPIFYLDARRPRHGNWTRYVNCARTRAEENVEARQEGLRVFYYAKRDIAPGEELLVWYGSAYGEWLLGRATLD